MSFASELLTQRRERRKLAEKRSAEKYELLANPDKLDKLVASHVAAVSPSVVAPKKSKFSTETEALQSVIDEDSPMKNFGTALQTNCLACQHKSL